MIPRFQHLLVPLDFAPRNNASLEVAFEVVVREPASVTLLHVVETIHDYSTQPEDELNEFYDRLQQRALSELDSRAQRFSQAGVKVNQRVRFGARAVEIVSYAEDHAIDLIVMSSHPIDRTHLSGSLATVSYQVSVLCSCPVLLVK